jgi:hypothetical protein
MEAHGLSKGLHKYWENEIKIPKSTMTTTSIPTPIPMPVHLTISSELEYELCKSVALSLIVINVVNISGAGLNPSGTSLEAWKLLLDQYGKTSD